MSRRAVTYAQCGLRLRSEYPLSLTEWHGGGWDVLVRRGPDLDDPLPAQRGEVIATYETAQQAWYTITRVDTGYHMRFFGCCDAYVSADLSNVEVQAARTELAAIIPVLLAGTVLSLLLTLRGNTVLHASAVNVDGHALVFTGHSGRGKSTTAALLCVDADAELITDDVLTATAGPPTCLGGAPELRLREGAQSIVGGEGAPGTRPTVDDRLGFTPRSAPAQPFPIAAIVIPGPSRTTSELTVELIPPSTALFEILAFPRVYGWCDPAVLSRDFATLSRIVNDVPVYNATIPWGPPFDHSIGPQLAELARR